MRIEDDLSTVRICSLVLKEINYTLNKMRMEASVKFVYQQRLSFIQSIQHGTNETNPYHRALRLIIAIDYNIPVGCCMHEFNQVRNEELFVSSRVVFHATQNPCGALDAFLDLRIQGDHFHIRYP